MRGKLDFDRHFAFLTIFKYLKMSDCELTNPGLSDVLFFHQTKHYFTLILVHYRDKMTILLPLGAVRLRIRDLRKD